MINIRALQNTSRAMKYPKGTILNRADTTAAMYILLQGNVALLDQKDNKIMTTVGPGEFFGDTVAFLENSPPFISIAINDVIALPIDASTAMDFIAQEPALTYELIKSMCLRFDQLNAAYETLCGHQWVDPNPLPIEAPTSEVQPSQEPIQKPAAQAPKAEPPCSPSNPAFSLFPAGHKGNYELNLPNADREHLMDKEHICPICNSKFRALKVKSSKLVLVGTSNDMRRQYQDIEPTYYEVVTCPHCLYSALATMFDKPDIKKGVQLNPLKNIKDNTTISFGDHPDTSAIFAEYYLALFCVDKCFAQPQLAQAKLLIKLSWIYHDCNDEQMEAETTKQALDAYMNAYLQLNMPAEQEQQLCMIIGELNFKLGNSRSAREFYLKAKINRSGTNVLKRKAEDRLEDIKALEQTEQCQNGAVAL